MPGHHGPKPDFARWAGEYADAMIAEDLAHAAKSAPSGAVHNPDDLTPEQVGTAEGWRLLDADEIRDTRRLTFSIQKWVEVSWDDTEWRGGVPRFTYRTKLSREELAKLP